MRKRASVSIGFVIEHSLVFELDAGPVAIEMERIRMLCLARVIEYCNLDCTRAPE